MNAALATPCKRLVAGALALVLAACASVPTDERLLAPGADGRIAAAAQPCAAVAAAAAPAAPPRALPRQALRVVSWNLHKGEDDGWEADLGRFAAQSDVVLLQEAVMTPQVRAVLERSGMAWRMAGAFAMSDIERGVMTAARVEPEHACTLRAFEPLFPLPKSALVARYRLDGGDRVVAIANLHAVNFTLGLGRFREQLQAVADELQRHRGPAILAGDFNTWSPERNALLDEIARQLGMKPIEIVPDGRRRVLGLHLDHVLVRGFSVVQARSPEVKSSDHNPILFVLNAD